MTLFERLLVVVDARVPPSFREGPEDELRRARLVLLFCWALTGLAPVFVASDLKHGRWANALVILSAVPFGVFARQVFARTRSLVFMGNYATAVFGAVLGARTLMTGGITAFAPYWMSALPVLSLLLAGRRSAFVWLGLDVAFFGAILGATLAGVSWMDTWTADERQREFLIATSFLAALMLTLAILFEAAKDAMHRQVRQRERDIRRMLDVMGQGFVTVSTDGRVAGPHSAALARWFGEPRQGQRFAELVAPHDASAATWLGLAFEGLVEDLLPTDVLLGQFPPRLRQGRQSFALEAKPALRRDGSLEAVVLVLTDITAQLEREAAEAEQRELVAVLDKALQDRRGFLLFFSEAEQLVADVVATGSVRAVHTLKGNAALFGANTIASYCHTLESQALERGAEVPASDREQLAQRWKAFSGRVSRLVMMRSDVLEVPTAEVAQLRDGLERQLSHSMLAAQVQAWGMEALKAPLERLAQQARALATRLGKPEPVTVVEDQGLRVTPERWNPVWSVFAHLVRNAVDHGLEDAVVRQSVGKPAQGRLVFSARLEADVCVLELRDDGRGVDWERVRTQARFRNLPAETREHLQQALLADGFSTADQVTDVSGRGLGMGAVAALVASLNGRLTIDSEHGQGTTIRLALPAADVTRSVGPTLRAA